jgi:hypothetical protein
VSDFSYFYKPTNMVSLFLTKIHKGAWLTVQNLVTGMIVLSLIFCMELFFFLKHTLEMVSFTLFLNGRDAVIFIQSPLATSYMLVSRK